MSVTVELSDELNRRLQAEAARRATTVDEVVAELVSALPAEDARGTAPPPSRDRLAFIGMVDSGRTELIDIRKERADLAAKRYAEGI